MSKKQAIRDKEISYRRGVGHGIDTIRHLLKSKSTIGEVLAVLGAASQVSAQLRRDPRDTNFYTDSFDTPSRPIGEPLAIGAPPKPGYLVEPGTRVVYLFAIEAPGVYVMETGGDQAWTLSLFAATPDCPLLEADRENRGEGLNARIVRLLFPEKYFLSVHHQLPDGTGPFTVWLRPA